MKIVPKQSMMGETYNLVASSRRTAIRNRDSLE